MLFQKYLHLEVNMHAQAFLPSGSLHMHFTQLRAVKTLKANVS